MSLLLCLSLFLAQLCQGQSKQYYRADRVALPDLPCDPIANVSACCREKYRCAAKLFCQDENGFDLVGCIGEGNNGAQDITMPSQWGRWIRRQCNDMGDLRLLEEPARLEMDASPMPAPNRVHELDTNR